MIYNPLVFDERLGLVVENVPPRFPVVAVIVTCLLGWAVIAAVLQALAK